MLVKYFVQPKVSLLGPMALKNSQPYLHMSFPSSVKTLDPMEISSTLISYTRQVALGMLYLSSYKCYVHRDLAARNILVSEDGTTCKVSKDLVFMSSIINMS